MRFGKGTRRNLGEQRQSEGKTNANAKEDELGGTSQAPDRCNRRAKADTPPRSSDSEIVDPLERRAAHAANHRVAVAAHQGIGHRPGTGGAVEFSGGTLAFGHTAIMGLTARP